MQDKLVTKCEGCVFATKEEVSDLQEGCAVHRLEKYVETGAKLGMENNHFIIHDRVCVSKRDKTWADEHTGEDLPRLMRDETTMQFQAFVITNNNLKETEATVRSLRFQGNQPNVVLIRKTDNRLPQRKVKAMLKGIKSYRIDDIVEEMDDRACIDRIFRISPRPIYMVLNAGCVLPDNVFNQLDEKVTDDLMQFGALLPNQRGDGLTIPSTIHYYYHGNLSKNIEDKVIGEHPELVLRIHDLVPNFPQ